MNLVNRLQILIKAVCISQGVNTLEKDMNQIIFSPAMGK